MKVRNFVRCSLLEHCTANADSRCRKCACALYSTAWPSGRERRSCVILLRPRGRPEEKDVRVLRFSLAMVCLQCQASVPLNLKLCQHVFQSKRKAEYSLSDQAIRVSKATKRASETSEQTLHRQQQDRKCKTSTRANETSEQSVHRKHVICQRHQGHRLMVVIDSSWRLVFP